MTGFTRRGVLKASAWGVPVVALSVAVPAAVASQVPENLVCSVPHGDVAGVTTLGSTLTVHFHRTAQNAVDVTIRLAGDDEIHYNLTRIDRFVDNGTRHERPYTPGGSFEIDLPRAYDRTTDWMQVVVIHNENCVAV